MSTLAVKVTHAIENLQNPDDDEVRKTVVGVLGLTVGKLSIRDVGWLYRVFVGGLLFIMIVSLGAVIWTTVDQSTTTTPDLILTIFTGSLGALAGLFIRSPGN